MSITTTKQLVAAVKEHGSLKATARKTQTAWMAVHRLYERALAEGLMKPLPKGRQRRDRIVDIVKGKPIIGGRKKALKAVPIERHPEKVSRFLFTCAQNNTKLHDKFWENLLVLREFYRAELHVSRFAYIRQGLGARGDKMDYFAARGEDFRTVKDFWFDDRIVPYISDERREVAPGLVWCGEANILPTASRPLSGLQTFTGRASGIFPHVKIAMESVPSAKLDPVKFNYTTGTVTQRNYIQRKEGLKAEFHHCYGALLVEVEPNGDWWCRQINADSEGTIYDLDVCVRHGEVHRASVTSEKLHGFVEGVTWGDIHESEMDSVVREACWSKGGILDFLRPKYQFMHDLLNMMSRNHHDIDDPHQMLKRYAQGKDNVELEVHDAFNFLVEEAQRPWCQTVVVNSNHDRAIMLWLKNRVAMHDPVNFDFWSRLNARVTSFYAQQEGNGDPIVLREAFLEATGKKVPDGIILLARDDSFIICPAAGGGIECGMHGDDGANGARGSTATFARQGRKINKGHDHTAAIIDSAHSAGCCLNLKDPPDYAHGASSWSNSHIITYVNGKRAIITQWGDDRKPWADR